MGVTVLHNRSLLLDIFLLLGTKLAFPVMSQHSDSCLSIDNPVSQFSGSVPSVCHGVAYGGVWGGYRGCFGDWGGGGE